jgi:uncharacterized protein YndB with AHSA1/START domain
MSNPVENPRTLVIERVFQHTPEKLWRALTESLLLAEWMISNDFEPTVGRKLQFRDFSSTHSTSAPSGGSRYRPRMSHTLSMKSGSRLSLKVCERWGAREKRQMR